MAEVLTVQPISSLEPARSYTDLEVIAYVQGWNNAPPGMPDSGHPLYYYDREKGWFYLTSQGYQLYKQNEELLRPTMAEYERRVQVWACGAVNALLGQEDGQHPIIRLRQKSRNQEE